ncbi:MAG: TatD family hydrolase [Fibrobacter sp.]|nr:TatD family hydrolase [Fibrobacter sp.]
MFIDTHCHLDSYEEQTGQSIDHLFDQLRSENAMPRAMIHVACNPLDFDRAIELSEKYPFVYTAFGIHPEYADTATDADLKRLTECIKHPKAVGFGEFGLDYHYVQDNAPKQIELFERQLDMGILAKKPLVLHLREADDDALSVLQSKDLSQTKIHVHCFTGTREFVKKILKIDAQIFVGFTGIVTFKTAENVREAAAEVPLDQLLLETDSPYMTPVPFRGKPCHPGHIPYTAKKLAEIKGIPLEKLYEECRQNTLRCYGI